MRPTIERIAAALALLIPLVLAHAADDAPSGRLADQAKLKPYGGLVGDWRGAGMPERGRTKGSWQETASWAWRLSKDSAALETTIEKGKYLKSARLRPGPKPHSFVLDATLADGSERTFAGTAVEAKLLVLTAAAPGEGPRRITLTPLHDSRLLMLLEGQDPANPKGFYRLAEVGYTRQGIAFAAGESGPVCIVTEGRGTIPVSYKGKTYHVCCSGCRDLFNENPEAVLAEAAERQKSREKK
jgi:YHS domain-containing protein